MKIIANVAGEGVARIQINKDRIDSVRMVGPSDSGKPFVSPGFVDLQLNGFAGVNFSGADLNPEKALGARQK